MPSPFEQRGDLRARALLAALPPIAVMEKQDAERISVSGGSMKVSHRLIISDLNPWVEP
jgi:hypothetical protein